MKAEHAIDWRKTAAEIQDDFERVCKERDEYKQDALRYRWLREQNETLEWDAWCVTNHDFSDEEGPARSWVGADLDAAIDSARGDSK